MRLFKRRKNRRAFVQRMFNQSIRVFKNDDRRTHVNRVDRSGTVRRDIAEALLGDSLQDMRRQAGFVTGMVNHIGVVTRQKLRKHLDQYNLFPIRDRSVSREEQPADHRDGTGSFTADIGGDVLISKGCEQVDAVHALDGSNGSNALLPGSLVHTEHADVWFSKVGAHRRRIVALCGEVCLQPLQDSRVSLCERLQLHITRLQNMLVGWLSHV